MPPAWAPTVQDIANILRARTVSKNGGEVGTFDSTTRPTDADVTGLIAQACNDIIDAIGNTEVPTDSVGNASSLAAIGASMMVEISYFPEQVGSARSPYKQLSDQYAAKLLRLQNVVVSEGGARPTNEYQNPAGAFGGPPVPAGWVIPQW